MNPISSNIFIQYIVDRNNKHSALGLRPKLKHKNLYLRLERILTAELEHLLS